MKKYYLSICFLLLVSFMDIDATAQTHTNAIDIIEQIERKRNRDLEEKLSETICNLSWLTEVTGEELQSEIAVSSNPIMNWLHSSRLQYDLRKFIRSNKPCDNETGNRPLHLALSSSRVLSSVIDVLIVFGADLYVSNKDGVMPINRR